MFFDWVPKIYKDLKKLERSKEGVTQLSVRCNDFWRYPQPTQYTRDDGYLSTLGVDADGIKIRPNLRSV